LRCRAGSARSEAPNHDEHEAKGENNRVLHAAVFRYGGLRSVTTEGKSSRTLSPCSPRAPCFNLSSTIHRTFFRRSRIAAARHDDVTGSGGELRM